MTVRACSSAPPETAAATVASIRSSLRPRTTTATLRKSLVRFRSHTISPALRRLTAVPPTALVRATESSNGRRRRLLGLPEGADEAEPPQLQPRFEADFDG